MRRTRTGFLVIDVLMGIALLSAVALALGVAVKQQASASRQLRESRAAMRLAEETMTSLQAGLPAPDRGHAEIVVARLKDSSPVVGCDWARVRVKTDDRSVELVGLIRTDASIETRPTTQEGARRIEVNP